MHLILNISTDSSVTYIGDNKYLLVGSKSITIVKLTLSMRLALSSCTLAARNTNGAVKFISEKLKGCTPILRKKDIPHLATILYEDFQTRTDLHADWRNYVGDPND